MIAENRSPCSDVYDVTLNDSPHQRRMWQTVSAEAHGMFFQFGPDGTVRGHARSWSLGNLDFIVLNAKNMSLKPIAEVHERHLFLKLVKSGSMHIVTKSGEHRFDAGSVLVTEPMARYEQRFQEGTELLSLKFPEKVLKERGIVSSPLGLVVPDARSNDTRALAEYMLMVASQSGDTSNSIRVVQARHMADLVAVVAGDPSAVQRLSGIDATLTRAKAFIGQHLHDVDLDVNSIASSLGVSQSHLHRAFAASDMTLMRYVWSCRLERAAELLASRGRRLVTIKEIAYRCGFENAAHFSRTFKERFGITPKEAIILGMSN